MVYAVKCKVHINLNDFGQDLSEPECEGICLFLQQTVSLLSSFQTKLHLLKSPTEKQEHPLIIYTCMPQLSSTQLKHSLRLLYSIPYYSDSHSRGEHVEPVLSRHFTSLLYSSVSFKFTVT